MPRLTWKWRIAFLCLAVVALGTGLALYLYFQQDRNTPSALIGLLPQSDTALFFADVAALRSSGLLSRLDEASAAQEPDYLRFVSETGFSYERDLDLLALARAPDQTFAVLRGRFDWPKLRQYAQKSGGKCQGEYCVVPGSMPARQISFFPVQRHVMALAISPDRNAAYGLLPRRGAPLPQVPAFPAWVRLPKRVLEHPGGDLPPAAQVAFTVLSPASQVTLGLTRPTDQPNGEIFLLQLSAECGSSSEAQAVGDHLKQFTDLFRKLSKQAAASNSSDLSPIIASGTFFVRGSITAGEWRVPASYLTALLR